MEWSDFELKSAEGTLDALVAFAKKEEVVYGVMPRDASRAEPSVSGTVAIPNVASPNPKKKRRRFSLKTKTNDDERSESEGEKNRDVRLPVATSHAFAEGFAAARALVRAVAAARADGTLMCVGARAAAEPRRRGTTPKPLGS